MKAKRKAEVIRLAVRRLEIENIERLVGASGLRGLPWHAIFATQLRDGTASPEIVRAAEVSRRRWEAYWEQDASRRRAEQVPEAAPQEQAALAKKATRARRAKTKKA